MMLFEYVFGDVAARDCRVIRMVDRMGKPATFVPREFYCTEANCDCRRVLIQMQQTEGCRIVATINHAFDLPGSDDGPQTSLDPRSPPSARGRALLTRFIELIATEPAYEQQLQLHYAMWREAVDNPLDPHHGKVRGVAHDSARFRPVFPGETRASAAKPSRQKPNDAIGLVVAKIVRADSKTQQRFRRLLEKVDRLRERLREWKDQRSTLVSEVTAYHQLVDQESGLLNQMVRLLDGHLGDGDPGSKQLPFSKAEHKKLSSVISAMAGELIDRGGYDELKPIYNRYSRGDYDAEAAAADASGADAMKAMMEMFGADFGDADVSTMEKLHAYAVSQAEAAEREQATATQRRGKRKKSAKQMATEARKADEAQLATKALQNVYRALAWELHPDREPDPAERERKAGLMREVNIAYEAKDLLRLLELQIQLERLDPERVETVAEDRLRHYNRVLDDQAKQLAIELDDIEMPFRIDLDVGPQTQVTPHRILMQIRNDRAAAIERVAALQYDVSAFKDARCVKVWLRTQQVAQRSAREFGGGAFR